MDLTNITLGGLVEMVRHGTFGKNAAPVVTILAKNNSGGARARGDVVILDRANSTLDRLAFTTTTTANHADVLGMVYESIADGALGRVQIWGPTHSLKANGTTDIAAGDLLGTFTTAGIAQKSTGAGAFATAFEAYSTDDSSGVIDAFLHNLGLLGTSVAHDTLEADLGADVTMATGGTYYDGPSVSLTAGTWFLVGTVTLHDPDQACNHTAKLWDGTTVESSTQGVQVAGSSVSLTLAGVVTVTSATTWKISATSSGTNSAIKAAATISGAGNNASHLRAVKVK